MSYALSSRSQSHMQGVKPEIILCFTEAIQDSPIDFGIPDTGGVRTAEDQNRLHLSGASPNCDGYKRLSEHQIKPGEQYGNALDFYAYVNGKASWKPVHLAMVAAVILAANKRLMREGRMTKKLIWGGTFGNRGKTFQGWDYPHMKGDR